MQTNIHLFFTTILLMSCEDKPSTNPLEVPDLVLQDTGGSSDLDTNTDSDADDTTNSEDTNDTNDTDDTQDTDVTDTGDATDNEDTDTAPSNLESIDIGNGIIMEFSFIPAGSEPLERYSLSNDFHMLTTEITQGMYVQIMGYESYSGENPSVGHSSDHPAYYISWHMSADFSNALTSLYNATNNTSLSSCYSCSNSGTLNVECSETGSPYQCDGFRLPTEGEWEYAARSGTNGDFWTGDGNNLGGNASIDDCSAVTILDGVGSPSLGDYAWFCGNSTGTSEPVGLKLPNGFGLYDMHGNVWEWNSDQGSFTNGCTFPDSQLDPYCTSGDNRVMRGGYWNKRPDFLRSSYTISGSPSSRNKYIGARLVRMNVSSGGNVTEICDDTCTFANDAECDDGGFNSQYSVCDLGTDCSDCGVRSVCEDVCADANDGICDDGGPNDSTPYDSLCDRGTDCADCGTY